MGRGGTAARALVLASLLAAAGLAAAFLAYALRAAVVPFALAAALAYLLAPAVDALCRRGLSRTGSILLVYAVLALGAIGFVTEVVPGFLRELEELGQTAPRLVRALEAELQRWQRGYEGLALPRAARQALERAGRRVGQSAAGLADRAVEAVMGLAGLSLALILAPFLAYYMLRDLDLFRRRVLESTPPRWRPRVQALLRDLDRVLGGFVRGQVVVAAIVGGLVALATALLGMPFPLLLGLSVGIGEFVPYFGPVVGSLPALAVAALQSPGTLVRLVLFLVAIHQLEQALITPRVLGAGVGLHPLAVVLAILVGGELLGLFGVILAVPVTAAGLVLYRHAVAELRAAPAPGDGRVGRDGQPLPVPAGEPTPRAER